MMTPPVESTSTDCTPDNEWPVGKKAAFYTAAVAFGLGMFDFIDRQVLAAIIPFIKAEWQLTDTEVGMMIAIVNVAIPIMVIPSAYLIDRWSRKKMLFLMGTVWSLATGACALAGNFSHMMLARFFVGAGEAGYNPAAVPLLSASFPKKWRGTAVSITQLGTTLGVPLGTIIGAFIATHWGWRHAFGIVMVPGLILAILALFIKDYKTNTTETSASGEKMPTPSYLTTLKEVVRVPSLLLVIWGALMFQLFNGTVMNWLPSYFVREGGLSVTQSSLYFAIVSIATVVGIAMSGPLIDFARRRRANGLPIVLAFGLLMGTVLFGVGYGLLTPGTMPQVLVLALGYLLASVMVSGSYIAVVELSRPNARATATSIMIFAQNVFGFALGPVIAGMLSDTFSLGVAMQIIALAPALAGLGLAVCCFTFKRDVERLGCLDVVF